jgi:glycosyltransferase involved in cell wall biosynthesis
VKIAIVTPVNPPPNQGGLQVVTQLLAEALRRRGNIVDIFSPKEIRYSWNVFGGIDFLGDLRNPPDIFHVQQCDLSVRYAFLLKKKYPDIPVVTTVHGMFAVDPFRYCKIRLSPSEPARQLLRIIPGRYFEKESVRASDYVIAVSEDLERACKEIRKDTRVFTVPNGIDLGQFRQREFTLPQMHCPIILCPGRIYAERGQLFLIEALPEIFKHQNAQVVFVGSNDKKYLSEVFKRAGELGVMGKIKITDPVPYSQITGIYRRADLVAIPTLNETFGMAILENMAMGNVVVASNVGNIPKLIDNGINGLLVEPQNPHELAEAIIRGLTDLELRRKIWENAPRKAAMFDIQKTAENVEEIYRNVI